MKSGLFSKTFVKYLSSYVFAFLVPLLLTYIFIYIYVFDTYKNEVLFNEKAKNVAFRDTMDVQIAQLYNIAQQISIEDEFKQHYNLSPYNRMKSYEKLYGYDFANSLISNIAYFQSDIDIVVTSRGTCPKEKLSRFLLKYADWPDDIMAEEIYAYKYPTWRPFEKMSFYNESFDRYISFIYPMVSLENNAKKVLLFQIREQDFVQITNIGKANKNGNSVILNAEGEALYSTLPLTAGIKKLLPSVVQSNFSEHQTEGSGYFLSYARSGFNGFIYINILPVSTAMEKVNRLKQIVLLLFLAIILVGGAIIYVSMHINYNPVRSLKSYIEKNLNKMPGSGNEIETAKLAISMLSETSARMREQIDSSREVIKSTMLYELLWGEYKSIDEFNGFGRDYGIRISSNSFCVAVFEVKDDIRRIEAEGKRVIRSVEDGLKGIPGAYGIENMERNSLVFILALDSIPEDELDAALIRLREDLQKEFASGFVIGISGKCGIGDNLYNLYIEAVTAIEHSESMPSKAGEGIIRFGGIRDNSKMDYPMNEIEKFQSTIAEQDIDGFNMISKYLLNYVERPNISIFFAMCILYDMVNSITRTMLKVSRQDFMELFRAKMPYKPEKCNNVVMLKESVTVLCSETAEYMKKGENGTGGSQINRIRQFIKEHFNEYNFTLQVLADKFNMSLSNIGHYFKNNTGITLTEYLSQLKFDEAKKMLRNTDLTLEEIVDRIGYVSISSFIRRFKQDMKITPGEYRTMYKKTRST